MRKTEESRNLDNAPVSISSFNQGKANKIFEEVNIEGIKVVLKNNKRIGVIISPSKYDEMAELLEDYKLLLTAMDRMKSKNKEPVQLSDVMKRFGITQEDLDDTEVDIDI